jgi:hypothetical protein
LTRLLVRIISAGNGVDGNIYPRVIIPEMSQQSSQSSTKAKILSFPTAEGQLNARFPAHLEVFEAGGNVFLREPEGVDNSPLYSVQAGVLKFGRARVCEIAPAESFATEEV